MKFLLDADVEYRLATFLQSAGHEVKTIARDYPTTLTDKAVLAIARTEQRILLTNDRDYGELIFRQHLPHHGVIYFRLKKSKDISIKIHWLEALLHDHKGDLHEFLVVSPSGVRIRKTKLAHAA